MAKQLRAGLVHDGFCLWNGKIKFFSQDFEPNTINQAALQDISVSHSISASNPTVDIRGDFVSRDIIHGHRLLVRVPFEPPFFRVRVRRLIRITWPIEIRHIPIAVDVQPFAVLRYDRFLPGIIVLHPGPQPTGI